MESKEQKLEKLRKITGIVTGSRVGDDVTRKNEEENPSRKREKGVTASNSGDAMEAAVRLLSSRNHTEREIERKLSRKAFDRETIAEVIRELRRLNYVDDGATAGIYLKELMRKGYGSHKVRSMMVAKGLDKELVDRVVLSNYTGENETENAFRALEKKRKTFQREKDPGKRREKAYRYLYSRGFSSSIIAEVIHLHDDENI